MVPAGNLWLAWWRRLKGKKFLRLDTARGMLLHGRWHRGWQGQREYPLLMFAAVAAEEVTDDYRGYYGRLWLVSVDGQNDLVLEEKLPPYRNLSVRLGGLQSYIARATGLAKQPIIYTRVRAVGEMATNPQNVRALQPKAKRARGWRQPSEAKAALAARQAVSAPRLPGRAAPQARDGAEFAAYPLGTLLSRIPLLLLAWLMTFLGRGSVSWQLFWLALLVCIVGRMAYHCRHLRKLRYAAREDELIVYRLRSFRWLPEKRYALREFCGVYCRARDGLFSATPSEIWLAGKAGGKDVRLLQADFMMRNNLKAAKRTAKKISRACGLPLLEYVQGEEAT